MRADRRPDRGPVPTDQGEGHPLDEPGLARAMLDKVRANIVVADAQYRLVYMNAKATETMQALGPEVREQFAAQLGRLLVGDTYPHDADFSFGGALLGADVNRVTRPDGTVAGYVVAWANVTEARAARERAQRLAERLIETQEVSAAIQTVASATEQMAASANEIARNASEASATVAEAVSSVEAANQTMTELRDASGKINDIVRTITAVAEQTNLLALNATIEAARAGDAGKGFAVVASEVKDLAQETARATEDIVQRVEAIQIDTTQAIEAIARISEVIGQINDHQATIASTVEEQSATTHEMTRSIGEAATGVNGIAGSITEVAGIVQATTSDTAQARQAATALADMGTELRGLVGRFRY